MVFNKSLSDPALVKMYEDGSRHLPSCLENLGPKFDSKRKQKTIEARYDFDHGYDDASCNHWDGLRKSTMSNQLHIHIMAII